MMFRDTIVREKHGGLTNRWFLLLGGLALFFIARFLTPIPESAGDPIAIRTGLAILALVGFYWLTEALPLATTALFVPVLATAFSILTPREAFANFAHPLIFLFVGGFGIAAALSRQEIDRYIAQKILHWSGGRFLTTAIALAFTSAFLSMWISNTATVALLLPVALGILGQLRVSAGEETARRLGPVLLLGIAYSASIGGMGSLIGSPPNAIAASALGIDFASWLRIGVPCTLILLPVCLFVLHFGKKTHLAPRLEVTTTEFEWTLPRIATLVIFLLTVLAWLLSKPLSDALGIEKDFDSIVAIGSVVSLGACGLVQWADIDRTTDWGTLLLFGGGLTLSEVLKDDRTGASGFLAHQLAAVTSGWPTFLLILAVVLFVIFLTELSSNTATTALLVPIFASLASTMGFSPAQLVIPLALAASCAFMLPIATPPNALVYGSGHVEQKDMMREGFKLNLTLGLLLATYAYFFLQ